MREAGATFAASVKLVWYAREQAHLPELFAVRDRWLEARYPEFLRNRAYASTVVIAELSYPDVLVEIVDQVWLPLVREYASAPNS